MPVSAKPIGFKVMAVLRPNSLDHGGFSRISRMHGSVVAFYNTLDAIAAKWTQARRLPERLPKTGGFSAIPTSQNPNLV
jgi:hypothetical protein